MPGILRPLNLLILFVVQFSIWFRLCLPPGDNPGIGAFILICLMSISFAAAGYVINDIFDEDTDLINKPEKTYINRVISKNSAYLLYFSLNLIGVILLIFLNNIYLYLIGFSSAAILYLYAYKLKKTVLIGNITVALLTALSVYLFKLYYNLSNTSSAIINIYTVFAFLSTVIREIVKDLEDREGDEKTGIRTIAHRYSAAVVKRILLIPLSFLSVLLIYSCFLPGLNLFSITYLIIFLMLPLFYITKLLFESMHKKDFSKISLLLKAYILFGIIWLWI